MGGPLRAGTLPAGTWQAAAMSPMGNALGPSAPAEALRSVARTQPLRGLPASGSGCSRLQPQPPQPRPRVQSEGSRGWPPAHRQRLPNTESAHRPSCRSWEAAARRVRRVCGGRGGPGRGGGGCGTALCAFCCMCPAAAGSHCAGITATGRQPCAWGAPSGVQGTPALDARRPPRRVLFQLPDQVSQLRPSPPTRHSASTEK